MKNKKLVIIAVCMAAMLFIAGCVSNSGNNGTPNTPGPNGPAKTATITDVDLGISNNDDIAIVDNNAPVSP